jgi:hypothetical protein
VHALPFGTHVGPASTDASLAGGAPESGGGVVPLSAGEPASESTLPPELEPEPLPLLLPLGPLLLPLPLLPLLPPPELLPLDPESAVPPLLPASGVPALPATTQVPAAHVCEQQSPNEAHGSPFALQTTPLHEPATQSWLQQSALLLQPAPSLAHAGWAHVPPAQESLQQSAFD